jgi:large subunit ribosomal protein L20
MPRAIDGTRRKDRRKKYTKRTKGFYGRKKSSFKAAKEAAAHADAYAFCGRKQRKRDFRSLWIARISAVCRENQFSYSKFINALKKGGILINRKILSNMAIDDAQGIQTLITKAKSLAEVK